jgi:RNA polymerase sigma-70 factor (ECF subfamily)
MEINVPNEAELLEWALRFDRQALTQIYVLYSPGLYRYALRLLGDTAQAEDCVAETFSRFLQALYSRNGPKEYIQAYLYRIAHNWIADQYRKAPISPGKLSEYISDDSASPENEFRQRNQQKRLRAALKQLTPDQQQIIVLKFIEGWENEEISHAAGKPVGAIKSLQHRALARLKCLLDHEDYYE